MKIVIFLRNWKHQIVPGGVKRTSWSAGNQTCKGLICEQNVDEMKRIFNKKFPKRLAALDKFLSIALLTLELVPIPTDENISESQIRDADDRPILRAAIEAKADILLTGDKDFLESGLKNPIVITPAEFLNME